MQNLGNNTQLRPDTYCALHMTTSRAAAASKYTCTRLLTFLEAFRWLMKAGLTVRPRASSSSAVMPDLCAPGQYRSKPYGWGPCRKQRDRVTYCQSGQSCRFEKSTKQLGFPTRASAMHKSLPVSYQMHLQDCLPVLPGLSTFHLRDLKVLQATLPVITTRVSIATSVKVAKPSGKSGTSAVPLAPGSRYVKLCSSLPLVFSPSVSIWYHRRSNLDLRSLQASSLLHWFRSRNRSDRNALTSPATAVQRSDTCSL